MLRAGAALSRPGAGWARIIQPRQSNTRVVQPRGHECTGACSLCTSTAGRAAATPAMIKPRPGFCFNCNRPGHSWQFCEQPRRCFRCAAVGHDESQCSEPFGCYLCGAKTHEASRCKSATPRLLATDPHTIELDGFVVHTPL